MKFFDKLKKKISSLNFIPSKEDFKIFGKILYDKVVTFDIDQRAAAVAYNFMLAVFPGIIFLFTLIAYIPISDLDQQILSYFRNILPRGIFDAVERTIVDIISRKRSDVLSLGFLFATFSATNGSLAFIRAFNSALEIEEKRGFLKTRLIALLITIMLVLVLITAIFILTSGKFLVSYFYNQGFYQDGLNNFLVNLISFGSIYFIFYIGISIMYFIGPDDSEKLKFISFGSFFATVMCIVFTNLFSLYLAKFSTFNRLYGSIGTLMGLMIWFYLISLIIILGFEINTSIRETRKFKSNEPNLA